MTIRQKRPGFTLIELLVVVLIVGVLVGMGLTQYGKTVETAKAEEALSIIQSIANANRQYALDRQNYLKGSVSDCLATGSCPAKPQNETNPSCSLMYCGYLPRQDYKNKPYAYHSADGPLPGACAPPAGWEGKESQCTPPADAFWIACAKRQWPGGAEGQEPYNKWGYGVTKEGVVYAFQCAQPVR